MSEVAKGKLSTWIVALATLGMLGLLGFVLNGMYIFPTPLTEAIPFWIF